jgi:hypothetical protein
MRYRGAWYARQKWQVMEGAVIHPQLSARQVANAIDAWFAACEDLLIDTSAKMFQIRRRDPDELGTL